MSLLIRQNVNPSSVFISGSATGYYGDQDDALVDEDEPPIIDFAHTLCARWEDLALRAAQRENSRVSVAHRRGAVQSRAGWPRVGDGTQFMSWIHIDDIINALLFMLTTDGLASPFNVRLLSLSGAQ